MATSSREFTLSLDVGEDQPDFRNVTEECAMEVLVKVEYAEQVRLIGGDPGLLAPR
jgi:hypothetical protein